MLRNICLILVVFCCVCTEYNPKKCTELNFLPMPHTISCDIENNDDYVIEDPCRILYHIKGDKKNVDFSHFKQLIEHQQLKSFHCHISNIIIENDLSVFKLSGFKYVVNIQVEDPTLKSAFTTEQEAYNLRIQKQNALLRANHYVGFVHALETFLQSIECGKYSVNNCTMKKLPISIEDKPQFVYRSVMVDTSRHFLPVHLLYETIDALMYNKMSVFHWHITDEDSFPLILDSHPQIAQYAAFSKDQTYTTSQARDLVRYALVRGIRIVPQLDTPGHAASWGHAPENKGVACTFGTGYMGPLDVTLDKTYKLVREVFAEIIDIFPDPYIHLGGDEVVLTCLQNKTEFIKGEGIKDHEIQRHYRRKQHKIIKELDEKKVPVYWMNARIDIEEGDVVHWWGGGMPPTTHKVIVSNYGPYYLDMGVGNYFGVNYGQYSSWLDLYNQNLGKAVSSYKNKENVLGAEVALWSQINNRYTHHLKIWIRSSSTAERTWTTENFDAKPNFFRRITAHERRMNRRGIPTAPATCQQCEFHPEYC